MLFEDEIVSSSNDEGPPFTEDGGNRLPKTKVNHPPKTKSACLLMTEDSHPPKVHTNPLPRVRVNDLLGITDNLSVAAGIRNLF